MVPADRRLELRLFLRVRERLHELIGDELERIRRGDLGGALLGFRIDARGWAQR
jgi:hypothetical protein